MKAIPFSKLHGCGNSFVIVDDRRRMLSKLSALARHACSASAGIGADGLIVLRNCRGADFEMVFYNPDGSRAEMCGNGIRCLVTYIYDRRISRSKGLKIKTGAGIIGTTLTHHVAEVESQVAVTLQAPAFDSKDVRWPRGRCLAPLLLHNHEFLFVSMGNPHVVTFVKKMPPDIATLGPTIEHTAALFPQRINVEFARIVGKNHLEVIVWERGAGLTKACGTGAAAVAVAAIQTSRVAGPEVTITLPGGTLQISWPGPGTPVTLTGPATHIATGVLR